MIEVEKQRLTGLVFDLPPFLGYAAYLIIVTGGGYHQGTEIALNTWLLMVINNMHWGHLMFKVMYSLQIRRCLKPSCICFSMMKIEITTSLGKATAFQDWLTGCGLILLSHKQVRRLELCMANRTIAVFLTVAAARLFYCHSRQAAYFMYGKKLHSNEWNLWNPWSFKMRPRISLTASSVVFSMSQKWEAKVGNDKENGQKYVEMIRSPQISPSKLIQKSQKFRQKDASFNMNSFQDTPFGCSSLGLTTTNCGRKTRCTGEKPRISPRE